VAQFRFVALGLGGGVLPGYSRPSSARQSTLQGKHMTMADRRHDFEPHAETWHGFIRGSIAVILACVYVLVGLVSIGFGAILPLFLGFVGMIVGFIAIAIDLRTGSRAWGASLGFLAVYVLITLINIY
jgi:hypothetical protein